MIRQILGIILIFFFSNLGYNQIIEPQNGVYQSNDMLYAMTNIDIHISWNQKIRNGVILFKNGKIIKVGKNLRVPKNAIIIDREGYTIYPSFIELNSQLGMPVAKSKKKGNYPQLTTLSFGPYYWNEAIHPEVNAFAIYNKLNEKNRLTYIKSGFGSVLSHQKNGIVRGTSVLLTLGESGYKNEIIKAKAGMHYSLKKGVSKQSYPSSQMGVIALLKQYFYDLDWYNNQEVKPFENESFNSENENKDLPKFFETTDKLELFRVNKIAEEFNQDYIFVGKGDEYERVEALKNVVDKIIIPANFPKPYELKDPFLARFITLRQLKNWEIAAYNPYLLHKNGIEFSFSATKNIKGFISQIRLAVKHGLPKDIALKSLTENPANWTSQNDLLGSIEKGKLANFIVVKGDLFEDGVIYENYIRGNKTFVTRKVNKHIAGNYNFHLNGLVYPVKISNSKMNFNGQITYEKVSYDSILGTVKKDTLKSKMDITIKELQFSSVFYVGDSINNGIYQLNGTVNNKLGIIEGNALNPKGEWAKWHAVKLKSEKKKEKTKTFIIDTSAINNIKYPNMAFGFDSLPTAKKVYISNITIWTNEKEGIIKNGFVLLENGKIKGVYKKDIKPGKDCYLINGEGLHLTSGIIDEHSHIAISKGVNESGQAISAEVSIADVVRSDDINIYRQLAGGVTCSQLLHGSSNPIGGQSALIKLKWGYLPSDMLVESAPPFIKFALGENVKQSNWGDFNRVRFPQTRMGVEQVFYDAFFRAKAYEAKWGLFNKNGGQKPRKDLELEVLLEIVNSKRFVTCHSYIQSEINMLMTVADSVGFTLNTFTHILEGYKVADKMKEHGAGASTFSDWWAYKFEVNEAIPYNASILSKMGIITAINSDDPEMGRRLNHEAAKIVKYGGISQVEAWKMITLNPAKLLRVDKRMGSVKVGKDADIVIWSDNPLSVKAQVKHTFIDGIEFYNQTNSNAIYSRDQKERKRLIQLMLSLKNKGAKTQKPIIKSKKHYHCDTMGE